MMNAVPMISDAGLTDDESPPDSPAYDEADLLHATDEMMAQLAAAGLSLLPLRLHPVLCTALTGLSTPGFAHKSKRTQTQRNLFHVL